MKKFKISVVACIVAISGCTKIEQEHPKVAKASSAPVHIATMDEWTTALTSSYKEDHTKNKGDGVTEFMAVFGSKENNNFALAFGERDGFRKLRIYQAGMPMKIGTGVKAYVSVLDGKMPILFLTPYFWGHGWIFMKKLSIMVNGNVVLEHTFETTSVNRDTKGVGVEEYADFVVGDKDIEALRKVLPGADVIVRISGEKGYVNLNGDERKKEINSIKEFKDNIASALLIYDAISKTTGGHIPKLPPES